MHQFVGHQLIAIEITNINCYIGQNQSSKCCSLRFAAADTMGIHLSYPMNSCRRHGGPGDSFSTLVMTAAEVSSCSSFLLYFNFRAYPIERVMIVTTALAPTHENQHRQSN
jgi:hypothetical protein